jgi:hypothetical protein
MDHRNSDDWPKGRLVSHTSQTNNRWSPTSVTECWHMIGLKRFWPQQAPLQATPEMRDFRLPLRCSWDHRSSGMSRSVGLLTDVSWQSISPVFNGQKFQEDWDACRLTIEQICCSETSV